MSSEMKVIPHSLLSTISGGHVPVEMGTFALVMLCLEIPHMIVGTREFVNYVGERVNQGCSYEEGDYFTAAMMAVPCYIASKAEEQL